MIIYSRVSITRISREVKINSTYVFFELQILHCVYRNSIGTKRNSSYQGFRVIETRLYIHVNYVLIRQNHHQEKNTLLKEKCLLVLFVMRHLLEFTRTLLLQHCVVMSSIIIVL